MTLSIASIQRNRNPWIVEWLAFHMVVGFDEFHVYCHKCTDGMDETLRRLGRHYPVRGYVIDSDDRPQLAAYQHAWNTHGKRVDWMAFLDGDEFLFPTADPDMASALAPYRHLDLSALGAYWICYGSSGHLHEPAGLVVENYTRHSRPEFAANRHMKSIVRGGADMQVTGSHLFATGCGTYDDRLRPITHPQLLDPAVQPTWDRFRINHYVTQSHGFFVDTKQHMGAADLNPHMVRPTSWFHEHDRNEMDDGVSYGFLIRLKLKVRELQAVLA
jgi:hypothetical protein